ncbi:MAG: hypothetical protein WAS27_00570 [Candidatus Saccharimonadales bacterium]
MSANNFGDDFNAIADMLRAAADKLGNVASKVDAHDAAMQARIDQARDALGGAATFHNNAGNTPADVTRDRSNAEQVSQMVSAIDTDWQKKVDNRLSEHNEKLTEQNGHLAKLWELLGVEEGASKRLDNIEAGQVEVAEQIKAIKESVQGHEDRFDKLEKSNKFDGFWFAILLIAGLLVGALIGLLVGAWVLGMTAGAVVGAVAGYIVATNTTTAGKKKDTNQASH